MGNELPAKESCCLRRRGLVPRPSLASEMSLSWEGQMTPRSVVDRSGAPPKTPQPSQGGQAIPLWRPGVSQPGAKCHSAKPADHSRSHPPSTPRTRPCPLQGCRGVQWDR